MQDELGNYFKIQAHSVNFASGNVQNVLAAVKQEAAKGKYRMPRHQFDLVLTAEEIYYLQCQGFYITAEVIGWG